MSAKKLEWEEKYSVGVLEIDNQHKKLFDVINELLDAINENKPKEHLSSIIDTLLKYKKFHFETEEKYFKEFNYEDRDDHTLRHREFSDNLTALREKHPEFSIEFAFDLVDFLENWIIAHLMKADQKYKKCFNEHGLH